MMKNLILLFSICLLFACNSEEQPKELETPKRTTFGEAIQIGMPLTNLNDSIIDYFKSAGFSVTEQDDYWAKMTDGQIQVFLGAEKESGELTINYFTDNISEKIAFLQSNNIDYTKELKIDTSVFQVSYELAFDVFLNIINSDPSSIPSMKSKESALLGTFEEIMIPVKTIKSAIEYWTVLGFRTTENKGNYDYRYAQMTDGNIKIGLHENELIFKPALLYKHKDIGVLARQLKDSPVQLMLSPNDANQAIISTPSNFLFMIIKE